MVLQPGDDRVFECLEAEDLARVREVGETSRRALDVEHRARREGERALQASA